MIRERDEQAELEYLAASFSSDDEDYVYDYDPNGGGGGGGGSGSSSDSSNSSSSESDNDDDDDGNRAPVEIVDLTDTADIVEGVAEGGEEPTHTAVEPRDIFLR